MPLYFPPFTHSKHGLKDKDFLYCNIKYLLLQYLQYRMVGELLNIVAEPIYIYNAFLLDFN